MTGFLLNLALVGALALPGAPAQDALQIEATIGGVDITTADTDDPVRLDPREEIPIRVTVRNLGDEPEEIRHVRLEGRALGLTFLTYDIGIRTTLDPGESTTVDTALDFFDLERQATGYLGTSLRVYDAEGRVIAEQTFVVDVRGDATSTLGIFALVVLILAVFSSAVLIVNTVRRRLPSNRFIRALQFAVAGAAIGVTLSLGVSILRIAFADVEAWAPLVFIPTVVAFFVGYVAPGPLQRSIRDYEVEQVLQREASAAVLRATGDQVVERTPAGD